jgi:hypothetical protein
MEVGTTITISLMTILPTQHAIAMAYKWSLDVLID